MKGLIAAEWLKIRALRSTWWTLALTALAVIGSAVLAAQRDYANFPGYSLQQQLTHGFSLSDSFPLNGYLILIVVAASFGAATMISEYSSGLIRATSVAVPARGELLLAKAAVVAAVWTVVGACTAFGGFTVAQAILARRHADVSVTDQATVAGLAGAVLIGPAAALVGLGIAVLLRHGGTTYVTAILLLALLPQLFTTNQPLSAEIKHATLLPAWQRLTEAYGPPQFVGDLYPPLVEAWLVYLIWPLAAVTAALIVHHRRDV
ncbi:ABC transporter permease [Dactylosporangium sp. NPDC049140]|uniref:ABC transporter permease n=1 Tax=Dactylosporangium sp. NPDC049140 TaxID=3155647 RepID=UPI0033D2C290